MNTLTQVWVFSIALCSFILVISFKLAGRLGLFIGFILSLVLLYLLLHKGLQVLLDQIKAKLHKGSDPTGLNQLLLTYQNQYPIKKYYLHFTDAKSQPLVWRNLSDELHIILNKSMVENLDADEKKILAHLVLSHGTHQSKLRRRLLSILYLALNPFSRVLSPVFNFSSQMLKLQKQIFKADLMALKSSNCLSPEKMMDFSLFLRKLHNLKFHQMNYVRGENYFSILSTSQNGHFHLKLCPPLDQRLKNLIGDSFHGKT